MLAAGTHYNYRMTMARHKATAALAMWRGLETVTIVGHRYLPNIGASLAHSGVARNSAIRVQIAST